MILCFWFTVVSSEPRIVSDSSCSINCFLNEKLKKKNKLVVRLDSGSDPSSAAYRLCDLGQVIATTFMKMMVLALGGHVPGDDLSVTLDSPAFCRDETPADEEDSRGHWPHGPARRVNNVSQKEDRVLSFFFLSRTFSLGLASLIHEMRR